MPSLHKTRDDLIEQEHCLVIIVKIHKVLNCGNTQFISIIVVPVKSKIIFISLLSNLIRKAQADPFPDETMCDDNWRWSSVECVWSGEEILWWGRDRDTCRGWSVEVYRQECGGQERFYLYGHNWRWLELVPLKPGSKLWFVITGIWWWIKM